jgi:hypothetical protein
MQTHYGVIPGKRSKKGELETVWTSFRDGDINSDLEFMVEFDAVTAGGSRGEGWMGRGWAGGRSLCEGNCIYSYRVRYSYIHRYRMIGPSRNVRMLTLANGLHGVMRCTYLALLRKSD